MVFKVYKDSKNEWRWRLVAANSRIIADSGEGYIAKWDAIEAIKLVASVTVKTVHGVSPPIHADIEEQKEESKGD